MYDAHHYCRIPSVALSLRQPIFRLMPTTGQWQPKFRDTNQAEYKCLKHKVEIFDQKLPSDSVVQQCKLNSAVLFRGLRAVTNESVFTLVFSLFPFSRKHAEIMSEKVGQILNRFTTTVGNNRACYFRNFENFEKKKRRAGAGGGKREKYGKTRSR